MRIDRLFEKAERLVASGRVEPLGGGVYNIIGDHGTYTVVQDHTGKLSCSCPGFLQKAKCSHVIAVILMTKTNRRRKPRQTRF
jgi:predicted nucleic acid-binding Zn finger protein